MNSSTNEDRKVRRRNLNRIRQHVQQSKSRSVSGTDISIKPTTSKTCHRESSKKLLPHPDNFPTTNVVTTTEALDPPLNKSTFLQWLRHPSQWFLKKDRHQDTKLSELNNTDSQEIPPQHLVVPVKLDDDFEDCNTDEDPLANDADESDISDSDSENYFPVKKGAKVPENTNVESADISDPEILLAPPNTINLNNIEVANMNRTYTVEYATDEKDTLLAISGIPTDSEWEDTFLPVTVTAPAVIPSNEEESVYLDRTPTFPTLTDFKLPCCDIGVVNNKTYDVVNNKTYDVVNNKTFDIVTPPLGENDEAYSIPYNNNVPMSVEKTSPTSDDIANNQPLQPKESSSIKKKPLWKKVWNHMKVHFLSFKVVPVDYDPSELVHSSSGNLKSETRSSSQQLSSAWDIQGPLKTSKPRAEEIFKNDEVDDSEATVTSAEDVKATESSSDENPPVTFFHLGSTQEEILANESKSNTAILPEVSLDYERKLQYYQSRLVERYGPEILPGKNRKPQDPRLAWWKCLIPKKIRRYFGEPMTQQELDSRNAYRPFRNRSSGIFNTNSDQNIPDEWKQLELESKRFKFWSRQRKQPY